MIPGRYPVIIGDLSVDIFRLQNLKSQKLEYFLASFSLVILLSHFRQRLRFRLIKTWWHV